VLSTVPARLLKMGPNSIVDRAELLAELATTRTRRYAFSLQESERGVHSVAVRLRGDS
jgi:DNA-binding IclR family transcriptional regulator